MKNNSADVKIKHKNSLWDVFKKKQYQKYKSKELIINSSKLIFCVTYTPLFFSFSKPQQLMLSIFVS